MKVVRDKSVFANLLRVLASAAGRRTIEYIELTPLEIMELEETYGVAFLDDGGDPNGNRKRMGLQSFDLEGAIEVRVTPNDKYSRARRVVKGDGRVNTR